MALQLAALAQIKDWVGGVSGAMFAAALILLILTAIATVAALGFLALSVWPADFRRIAREPAFLDYAEMVRAEARRNASNAVSAERVAEFALVTIKSALVQQYALAVDNNRLMNQRRAKWRTRAGLSTLISVFNVLVLVALVVVSSVHVK